MSGPRARWAALPTERRNPRSRALDRLSLAAVVRLVLDEDRRALAAALRATPAIARAAGIAARVLASGQRIVFLGAGTSGRLGVLEAAECPPTFGTDPDRIRAVIAGGRSAVFRAVEGAEDDGGEGAGQGRRLRRGDLLVGISASSVTPFVRAALAAARSRGADTVLVTCAEGRGLGGLADVTVVLRTGPEVLTGSTRLKAGSATKAALNAITTAAMVRLGKVYGNLMVDLRPGSAKLRDRARRVIAEAGGVSPAAAARLLADAGGEVRTAIVMARRRVGTDEARALLASAGGRIRDALRERKPWRTPSRELSARSRERSDDRRQRRTVRPRPR